MLGLDSTPEAKPEEGLTGVDWLMESEEKEEKKPVAMAALPSLEGAMTQVEVEVQEEEGDLLGLEEKNGVVDAGVGESQSEQPLIGVSPSGDYLPPVLPPNGL